MKQNCVFLASFSKAGCHKNAGLAPQKAGENLFSEMKVMANWWKHVFRY